MSEGQYVPQSPMQPPFAPHPQAEKKNYTGLIIGVVSGGVLLVLIVVGAIVFALQSAAHTPEKALDAYHGAVVHGDAHKALELGGVKVTSADLLLTNAAYRAARDHITRYALGDAVTNGDGAAVTARITQGSQHYEQSFALVKAGKDMLFFDKWVLKPVALGYATVAIEAPSDATITIAKVGMKKPSGEIRLKALPGTYPVAMSSTSPLYDAKTTDASVVGFTGASSKPAVVAATLTAAGTQAATDAVNAHLDSCAASTDFRPVGCSFGSTGESSTYTYSNQKWTLDPRPQFTIGSWIGTGWSVRTTTPGSATFTATISDGSGGTGTATAGPVAVRISGYVVDDGSGMKFTSLIRQDATA
jgi:hypothetical protein